MASTYSTNLRLELIGTGEQQGTWGATTNTNLGTLLEQAIGGYVSVTVSDVADTTLTVSNGASDQSRNMVINLTGTITAARNVICPAIQKLYVVKNSTTGGFPVVFKVSGQTGVSVPNGGTYLVYVDGTDAYAVTRSMAAQTASSVAITGGSVTGITDLAVADGGTGASSFTAYSVVAAGTTGTGAFQSVGTGTTGQILTSNGAAALPSFQTLSIPASFPSGTKLLFQQTSAPTGWTKDTTHNNKALRIVNGTVGSGGTVAFTTAFASQAVAGTVGNQTATGTVSGTVGDTALTLAQMPAHSHNVTAWYNSTGTTQILAGAAGSGNTRTFATDSQGSGATHTHTFSGSFSGVAHSHTFTGTAIDLAVQYVDVIIATKD